MLDWDARALNIRHWPVSGAASDGGVKVTSETAADSRSSSLEFHTIIQLTTSLKGQRHVLPQFVPAAPLTLFTLTSSPSPPKTSRDGRHHWNKPQIHPSLPHHAFRP